MDLHYLSSSEIVPSEVPLGSLGLIIFELGLPLTRAETGKSFTQMDARKKKSELVVKFRL
jgi:hypothetical protein